MHPSAEKFLHAAQERGLTLKITEFSYPTRTAQEAADAIGCDVAQIVKSLCFTANDQPVMALVSGCNQLDTKKLAGLLGVGRKKVKRAPAATVKTATGYTIGGVPPFGHATTMTVFIDNDLMQYDEIWAAAGTPHAVFPIAPHTLQVAADATVANVKQG